MIIIFDSNSVEVFIYFYFTVHLKFVQKIVFPLGSGLKISIPLIT